MSGGLASKHRVGRIGNEEGLGKIDNIIVDTSEEPTFNNEGDQECPDIVTKGVAKGKVEIGLAIYQTLY